MARIGTARAGDLVLAGAMVFLLSAIALHLIRGDLDWMDAQMSHYLVGRGGVLLQAGYCAMGVALVVLALGLRRSLVPKARSGAPVLLFALGGAGLCITAFAPMDPEGGAPTFAGWVHGLSAYTAFVCVITAMVVQSWNLRGDPQWRRRSTAALVLAAATSIGPGLLAANPDLPRGLTQKAVILVIAIWVLLMVYWLRRTDGPMRS